jgi:hypothetical protein
MPSVTNVPKQPPAPPGGPEEAVASPPRPRRDTVHGPHLRQAEQVVGSPEWEGAGLPPHAPERVEEPSAGELFPSDPRAALLLLNEARYRAIQGMFGVRRDQVNLMTLIAAMTLAEAAHAKTQRMRHRLRGPRRGEFVLAHGLVNGLGQGIAGPSSRDIPLFAPLIGTAMVGAVAVRVVRNSAHDVKAVSREIKRSLRYLFPSE